MKTTVGGAVAAGLGYVVGTFPSADIAARLAGGADLRAEGTGNPGAMNASHVLGRKWGAVVSGFDIGKGVVAARAGGAVGGETGANVAASAAVVGHCFPLGRNGGKGVATSLGQVIGTFPVYLPLDIGVAWTVTRIPGVRQPTRVAAAVASVTWVSCATLWWRRGLANPGGVRPTVALPAAAAVSSLVIAARFRAEAHKVDAYNAAVTSGHGP